MSDDEGRAKKLEWSDWDDSWLLRIDINLHAQGVAPKAANLEKVIDLGLHQEMKADGKTHEERAIDASNNDRNDDY